jgi:hypothetical protein
MTLAMTPTVTAATIMKLAQDVDQGNDCARKADCRNGDDNEDDEEDSDNVINDADLTDSNDNNVGQDAS